MTRVQRIKSFNKQIKEIEDQREEVVQTFLGEYVQVARGDMRPTWCMVHRVGQGGDRVFIENPTTGASYWISTYWIIDTDLDI